MKEESRPVIESSNVFFLGLKTAVLALVIIQCAIVLSARTSVSSVSEEMARTAAKSWLLINEPKAGRSVRSVVGVPASENPEFFVVELEPGGIALMPLITALPPVKLLTAHGDRGLLESDPVVRSVASRMVAQGRFAADLDQLKTSGAVPEVVAAAHDNELAWEALLTGAAVTSAETGKGGSRGVPEGETLLSSVWHQTTPYNDECPLIGGARQSVVGCTATALSQVMYYWSWPPRGLASTDTYVWSVTQDVLDCFGLGGSPYDVTVPKSFDRAYDWDLILDSYAGGSSAAQRSAVAVLCRDAGYAVEMQYGCSGGSASSGAWNQELTNALPSYFRYRPCEFIRENGHAAATWIDLIRSEIADGRPVQYELQGDAVSGHSVVADGYRTNLGVAQIHFNWGWGGSASGWYSMDALDIWGPYDGDGLVRGIYPKGLTLVSVDTAGGHPDPNGTSEITVYYRNESGGTVDGFITVDFPTIVNPEQIIEVSSSIPGGTMVVAPGTSVSDHTCHPVTTSYAIANLHVPAWALHAEHWLKVRYKLNGSPGWQYPIYHRGSASVHGGCPWIITPAPDETTFRDQQDKPVFQQLESFEPVDCSFELSSSSMNIRVDGDSSYVTIEASDQSCSWSAVTSSSWITVDTPTGQGTSARLEFTVASNLPAGVEREGSINIPDGPTFSIRQDGCFELTHDSILVNASGGARSMTLAANSAQCQWAAEVGSGASFLTLTGATSGTGPAVIPYTVDPNPDQSSRQGTLVAAGLDYTVLQEGQTPCSYDVAYESGIDSPAEGRTNGVPVWTQPDCPWDMVCNLSWVECLTDTWVGDGLANLEILPNPNPSPRSGWIQIAGEQREVRQAGVECWYSLDHLSYLYSAAGSAEHTIQVTPSAETCGWTAFTDSPWIEILSGTSGTGTGEVIYRVVPNPGEPRQDRIFIMDYGYLVLQAGAASDPELAVSVSGPGKVVSSPSGIECGDGSQLCAEHFCDRSTVQLSAQPVDGATFIGWGGGACSGTGPCSVSMPTTDVLVQATFEDTCTYTLTPGSATYSDVGGNGSFQVATQPGCGWVAQSSAQWCTVSTGAGTGSGAVLYTVDPNLGSAGRVATMVISDEEFTVAQLGPCSASIDPSSITVPPEGGVFVVMVDIDGGCQWDCESSAGWVTVLDGSPGTGSGTVLLEITDSQGTPRSTVVTIAGEHLAINQTSSSAVIFADGFESGDLAAWIASEGRP